MKAGDYGRETFKEIGKLSSMLPAYVRHCCRSLHDGTDGSVLDSYRETAYRVLSDYDGKYPFVNPHRETLRIYSPDMVKDVIIEHSRHCEDKIGLGCLATSTAIGLPKRACLHCPKVGHWIKIMNRAGTIDEKTGKRYGFK